MDWVLCRMGGPVDVVLALGFAAAKLTPMEERDMEGDSNEDVDD